MPSDEPPRRGKARGEASTPTGYRASEDLRYELQLAGLFLSEPSLQGVIDRAVGEFLERTRRNVPGFAEAAAATRASRDGLTNNVRALRRGGDGDAG